MEIIELTHTSKDGALYEASFLPSHGMTLVSYKKNGIEVIDQSTKESFDQRSAGLGVLIGPHFHRRKKPFIPKIDKEFPQSAYCKAHGIEDIFSHGVARYVPWKWETFEGGVKAVLLSKDLWCEVPLSMIEGQNFQMTMQIKLGERGLNILLNVVSDTDSLVGLHYYYRLPNGKGQISCEIKNQMRINGILQEVPKEMGFNGNDCTFALNQSYDHTFYPAKDPLKGIIYLDTEEFKLKIEYYSLNQENCFQIYHPENATFVCIEPISAQDPHHPNLSVSALDIFLNIT